MSVLFLIPKKGRKNIMEKWVNILKVQGVKAKGFGIIPKMVMLDKRLTVEAKAIYSYFCSYAGAGSTAFPSRDKICEDLGIGINRYYNHMKLLKDYGYIKTEQIKKGNRFSHNIYTLVENPESYSPDEGEEKKTIKKKSKSNKNNKEKRRKNIKNNVEMNNQIKRREVGELKEKSQCIGFKDTIRDSKNSNSSCIHFRYTHGEDTPNEYSNNNKSFINNNRSLYNHQSVSLYGNNINNESDKENDRQTDIQKSILVQFKKTLEKCEIEAIDESYQEAVKQAIKLLYLDIENKKQIKINGNIIPREVVELDLEKLDFLIITHAVNKFKEVAGGRIIKNKIKYLKSCIYNSISELNIDVDGDLRYAGVIR